VLGQGVDSAVVTVFLIILGLLFVASFVRMRQRGPAVARPSLAYHQEMFSESSGPLRLVVSAVFTITGRGTVAMGRAEQGRVQAGDRVEVIHGATRTMTTCRGIETFLRRDSGCDPREIGLLLPDLATSDVTEGDLILGVDSNGAP
jgi:translation elongation factor EF-Tu-like GTPase